mmetsp:Transcript_32/g.120  ORF Transcript_32/g.120 Transcript_32/m.120 type:complete len:94 (-) Transcript_32:23-304(-)
MNPQATIRRAPASADRARTTAGVHEEATIVKAQANAGKEGTRAGKEEAPYRRCEGGWRKAERTPPPEVDAWMHICATAALLLRGVRMRPLAAL